MGTTNLEPGVRAPAKRPSMWGFWVAGAVAVLGLVGAAVWALTAAVSSAAGIEDLERTALPGTVTVRVDEPRTLLVYVEGEPVPTLRQLAPRVTGADGELVPVRRYLLDLRYDSPEVPGTTGTAVAAFDARSPGAYQVESPYLPPTAARLAVGEDVGRTFVQTLVGPAALVAGSLLLAVAMAVVAAVRINAAYRQTRAGGTR
jgi:hypothetical protein